ncbi:MAG: P-II family nitrogen regulator [Planctomycetes bacterium]|nr:P-II family nitrogen regulator [Planctomycetota bacterium]
MKLVQAVIPPSKLEKVKEALSDVEVFRLSVSDVQGFGSSTHRQELVKERVVEFESLRKVKLEIAVNENFVVPTINAILSGAKLTEDETGAEFDGKIFVLPLYECIRIRTGERGPEAI